MDHLTAPRVEWGVAARAFEDGVSGDAHLVQALPAGALFGVVDGIGHGPAAAQAAREAIRLLAADPEHPVRAVGQCHERLKTTRGVVLMLAWLESPGDCLWWIGVGNAQGVLLSGDPEKRARQQTLIGRVGVVGRQLPPLRATQVPIASGDVLVLTTDGIRTSFTHTVSRHDTPQGVADDILERHWTRSDDGLVLVVRYQGATP
jgi:serine/threonine protein phosphatase PrpC